MTKVLKTNQNLSGCEHTKPGLFIKKKANFAKLPKKQPIYTQFAEDLKWLAMKHHQHLFLFYLNHKCGADDQLITVGLFYYNSGQLSCCIIVNTFVEAHLFWLIQFFFCAGRPTRCATDHSWPPWHSQWLPDAEGRVPIENSDLLE